MREKLSDVGLTTSSLSQSGIASLRTVCNIAHVLDVSDSSNTKYVFLVSPFFKDLVCNVVNSLWLKKIIYMQVILLVL